MRKSSSWLSANLSVLSLCCCLAACASGSAVAANEDAPLQVSVLIYSGRPNPAFALTAAQMERVRQLVDAARADPEFRYQSVLPSILGYNGVVIHNPRRDGGLPQSLATYGGRIEVNDGEGKRIVADGGALETFLLDLAAENKALDAEQRRAIESGRKRSD